MIYFLSQYDKISIHADCKVGSRPLSAPNEEAWGARGYPFRSHILLTKGNQTAYSACRRLRVAPVVRLQLQRAAEAAQTIRAGELAAWRYCRGDHSHLPLQRGDAGLNLFKDKSPLLAVDGVEIFGTSARPDAINGFPDLCSPINTLVSIHIAGRRFGNLFRRPAFCHQLGSGWITGTLRPRVIVLMPCGHLGTNLFGVDTNRCRHAPPHYAAVRQTKRRPAS